MCAPDHLRKHSHRTLQNWEVPYECSVSDPLLQFPAQNPVSETALTILVSVIEPFPRNWFSRKVPPRCYSPYLCGQASRLGARISRHPHFTSLAQLWYDVHLDTCHPLLTHTLSANSPSVSLFKAPKFNLRKVPTSQGKLQVQIYRLSWPGIDHAPWLSTPIENTVNWGASRETTTQVPCISSPILQLSHWRG